MPEETSLSAEPSGGSASSPSEVSQEPSRGFGETDHGGDEHGSTRGKDVSSASDSDERANGKDAPKAKSRYERSKEWRKSVEEREKRVIEAERRIAEHEERQRRSAEPQYDLDELKRYRQSWAREAEFDPEKAELVRQADIEIRRLESTQSYEQQWHAAEAQLRAADPDFGVEGTPIDRKIREILNGPSGPAYRKYALGIVAAYDLAKRLLLEEENKGLRSKWSRTEEENKRLTGLTSIGSGATGQMSGASGGEMSIDNFRKLSLDQMRERLRRDAASARGR